MNTVKTVLHSITITTDDRNQYRIDTFDKIEAEVWLARMMFRLPTPQETNRGINVQWNKYERELTET